MNVTVKNLKCLFITTVFLLTVFSMANVPVFPSSIYFGERFMINGIVNKPAQYSISLWERLKNDTDSTYVENLISNLCHFDITYNYTIYGHKPFIVPCNCISSQRSDNFKANEIQYFYSLYQIFKENQFKKEILRFFLKIKPLIFAVNYFSRNPNLAGKFNKLRKADDYSLFTPVYATFTLFLNDTKQLNDCSRKSLIINFSLTKNQSVFVELRYHYFKTLHRSMFGAFTATPSALSNNENSVEVDHLHNSSHLKNGVKYSQLIASKLIIFSKEMISTTIEFECWYFIKPGYYTIRTSSIGLKMLTTKWISINKIKSALHEKLHSGHNLDSETPITLLLRNDSIFPNCVDNLTLSWQLPLICSAAMIRNRLDFRIRVFAMVTSSIARRNNFASFFPYSGDSRIEYMNNFYDDNWIYLHEFIATKWENAANDVTKSLLAIPCSLFDIIHEKFCFELVSVERSTQHFELWDRKCVNTEPTTKSSISKDNFSSSVGFWSDWSEWSSCFIRRKHNSDKLWKCIPFHTAALKKHSKISNESIFGYRKRYRECLLTPITNHKQSALCENEIIAEKEECDCFQFKNASSPFSSNNTRSNYPTILSSLLFQNDSRQLLDPFLTSNDKLENFATPKSKNCKCGCNFTQENGAFYAGSKGCIGSSSVWTVSAGKIATHRRHITEVKRLIRLTILKTQDVINCVSNYAILYVFRSSIDNQLELIWTSKTQILHPVNRDKVNTDLAQKVFLIEKLNGNQTLVLRYHFQRNANFNYLNNCGFYVDYQFLNDFNGKNFVDKNIQNVYSAIRNILTHFFNKFALTIGCQNSASHLSTFNQPENILLLASFKQDQQKCEFILTLTIFGFAVFMLVVALLLPSFLCVILTNRLGLFSSRFQNKKHKSFVDLIFKVSIDDEKLMQDPHASFCSQRSDMLRSGDTNCTQLSSCSDKKVDIYATEENVKTQKNITRYITKRSIGIQLSRQTTPRLSLRNAYGKIQRKKSEVFGRSNSTTLNENLSASNSAAPITIDDFPDDCYIESETEDGLEYDYYEPPPPLCSFLCSALQLKKFELLSEIDIDEIVRQETFNVIANSDCQAKWRCKNRFPETTHEAHAQISEFEENCVL